MSFSTNEQGFRQPDQVPPDSHPVLFLGDSFTMGYGVNDGEDFVSLIRKQMPLESGPFLNAGMGDNGNGRWLKFLRYDAPRYGPKLVVLQVMGNDFTDNLTERLYAVEDDKLIELPVPKPGPRQWVRSIMNTVPFIANSHLVGLMRQVHVPAIMHRAASDGHSDDRDEVTFKLIDRAIEICEEQGWPALGLTVGVEGERLERLEGFFSERGVRLLGVASRDERPDLYYGIDGHWNAKGHRYAAELLLPEIRSLTNGELR
jgi:hypothetical protein